MARALHSYIHMLIRGSLFLFLVVHFSNLALAQSPGDVFGPELVQLSQCDKNPFSQDQVLQQVGKDLIVVESLQVLLRPNHDRVQMFDGKENFELVVRRLDGFQVGSYFLGQLFDAEAQSYFAILETLPTMLALDQYRLELHDYKNNAELEKTPLGCALIELSDSDSSIDTFDFDFEIFIPDTALEGITITIGTEFSSEEEGIEHGPSVGAAQGLNTNDASVSSTCRISNHNGRTSAVLSILAMLLAFSYFSRRSGKLCKFT